MLFAYWVLATDYSPQRTIPTSNNHQAKARNIITVTSFGVGEGIILWKVLLSFPYCVVIPHISKILFLRSCGRSPSSD